MHPIPPRIPDLSPSNPSNPIDRALQRVPVLPHCREDHVDVGPEPRSMPKAHGPWWSWDL